MRRRAFSAFLFQVIGNKHVLLAAVKRPVFSAAQPDADRSFSSAEQPAAMLQTFMDAWEEEKTTDAYKKRVLISQRRTKQQGYLKNAAHEARRNLVRGGKSNGAIMRGDRAWDNLGGFNSGKLQRVRDECDEAFGWNRDMRSAAGSAATRLSR